VSVPKGSKYDRGKKVPKTIEAVIVDDHDHMNL
jgi:hypothetical protein